MTAPDRCLHPTKCSSLLDAKHGGCGYKALRGDRYCRRGEQSEVIGLDMGEGWRSVFETEGGEEE